MTGLAITAEEIAEQIALGLDGEYDDGLEMWTAATGDGHVISGTFTPATPEGNPDLARQVEWHAEIKIGAPTTP